MDKNQKKEMLLQWKSRRPEMGVVSIVCSATGQVFADVSKDTQTAFNRHLFQLEGGMHPNKALQTLWKEYGRGGFECKVEKVLKYDDPTEDQTEKLEDMLKVFFLENPEAEKLSPRTPGKRGEKV